MESHLLQMRGLKLNNRRFDLECEESHLLQMRGLKQAFESGKDLDTVSHLLQMRGLKPSPGNIAKKVLRRIFYRCVD